MSEQLLKEILNELKSMNQRVGNLEKGFDIIASQVAELNSKVRNLESGQRQLETRLENEVIEKIQILFEANQLQDERYGKVMDKLESIEIDTGYLVSKVARLEKMAK